MKKLNEELNNIKKKYPKDPARAFSECGKARLKWAKKIPKKRKETIYENKEIFNAYIKEHRNRKIKMFFLFILMFIFFTKAPIFIIFLIVLFIFMNKMDSNEQKTINKNYKDYEL